MHRYRFRKKTIYRGNTFFSGMEQTVARKGEETKKQNINTYSKIKDNNKFETK